METTANAAAIERLAGTTNIVVKVGSSLITGTAMGGVPLDLAQLVRDVVAAVPNAPKLTFVSSGAVALGRLRMPTLGQEINHKQALSALGQPDLMRSWQEALLPLGLLAAQVLLTPDATTPRSGYLNARATLRTLLEAGCVPVINENDTVATDRLRYRDNDRLAAMTAGLVDADLLVILTDIDGLYTANPKRDPGAKHVPVISYQDLGQFDRRSMTSGSAVGTGGMATKIDAAHRAGSWGIPVILADGRDPAPLTRILNGVARATLIEPGDKQVPARRKWLGGLTPEGAYVVIDDGAVAAMRRGSSLLAVGVVEIDGDFEEGDVIGVVDKASRPVGFGLAKISRAEAAHENAGVIIHRDNFVMEDEGL